MRSSSWIEICNCYNNSFETESLDQNRLDLVYSKICNDIFKEMDNNLKCKLVKSYSKFNQQKQKKPYWTTELTDFLKIMNKQEKEYLKYKGQDRFHRNVLKQIFVTARQKFHKTLRQIIRQYNYSKLTFIDGLSNNNPNQFWRVIKSLGPRKN